MNNIAGTSSGAELKAIAAAIDSDDLDTAEQQLQLFLSANADDVRGLEMLAEVAARRGRFNISVNLLRRCLELSPDNSAPRQRLVSVLLRAKRPQDALREVEHMLARAPLDRDFRHLKARALAQAGEYESALAVYTQLLEENESEPATWLNYGFALKKLGRTGDCIRAFRRTIALQPASGEAWWGIASLKTEPLNDGDIATLASAAKHEDLSALTRAQLNYALGRAFEDQREYSKSLAHCAEGARLKRATLKYDPIEVENHVRRCKAFFTPGLLAERSSAGAPTRDPIFIVGLPRSGSTLIEQILASHSMIEGTEELPDLGAIAKRLGDRKTRDQVSKYPEVLATLSDGNLRELGESYLASTRADRHSDKPMFTDKTLSNFLHIGLILLILPSAKIIDARRHPMATCLSAFQHYFASGQSFTYALEDLGRYYRAYLSLMAHFDRIAPGRIHRVIYEDMIANTEAEVRRLLAYCGVAFEPACLRFFETDRVARTSSSEQVKQPIFTSGLEHWRNYEPWLGPLEQALGSALETYPDPPPDLA